jgi:hypothetical protein
MASETNFNDFTASVHLFLLHLRTVLCLLTDRQFWFDEC